MPDVLANDLWFMLLSTVRYSMGRCSYAPSYAVELVDRYRAHLAPEQLDQIYREVETELERHERSNSHLGHEMDHETWRRFVNERP